MGDNIFYSPGLEDKLIDASSRLSGATVFAHEVKDPERYGVVEFDSSGKAISIVEKPINPSSNYAVTGLYFFDSKACEIASSLSPSTRGELEITDVNATYLEMGNLQVEVLDKGSIWLDAALIKVTNNHLSSFPHYMKTMELTLLVLKLMHLKKVF